MIFMQLCNSDLVCLICLYPLRIKKIYDNRRKRQNHSRSYGIGRKDKRERKAGTGYVGRFGSLFKECNYLFEDINRYLHAPVNSGYPPPIPVFERKSSAAEANVVVQKVMAMIKEATDLLTDMNEYRKRYEFYYMHSYSCIKELKENIAHPGNKPKWAKLLKPAEKLPIFAKQLEKFLPDIPRYQEKLKQRLYVIKEIN